MRFASSHVAALAAVAAAITVPLPVSGFAHSDTGQFLSSHAVAGLASGRTGTGVVRVYVHERVFSARDVALPANLTFPDTHRRLLESMLQRSATFPPPVRAHSANAPALDRNHDPLLARLRNDARARSPPGHSGRRTRRDARDPASRRPVGTDRPRARARDRAARRRPFARSSRSPAISADGRFIAFQSDASDLVCARRCPEASEDINLVHDVFVFDRVTGAMTLVSADSAGGWMEESGAPAMDASGRLVAFTSRHPLHAQDLANDFDLFVRISARP
jgi:hypothetical protein